jgi:hypothetical protein
MLDAVDLWNTQIAARHAQPRLAWHECWRDSAHGETARLGGDEYVTVGHAGSPSRA